MDTPSGSLEAKNDELSSKRNKKNNYDSNHWLSDYNRLKGEESKQKILEIVAASEPTGKTSGELVKETRLHRDSIRLICNDLVKEKLILRSGGKFGKYHLSPKTFNEDPGLNAFLFATKVMRELNNLGQGYTICEKSIFCDNNFCKDTLSSDPEKPENLVDEIHFFESALRFGAILIYELIQAIRYSSSSSQQLQVPSATRYNYDLSNTVKNDIIIKYIENAVRPLLLIQSFRRLYPVAKRLKPEPQDLVKVVTSKEEAKIHQQQLQSFPSFLELQNGKFEELERKFKKTFPELFKDLEKIRTKDIPEQIDWKKHDFYETLRRVKQLEEKDPNHTKCNGELLPDIKTNIKGKKVQRCSKCHRWIEVKKEVKSIKK